MIEELNAARDLLNTALDRYISACSAIRNCCTRRDSTSDRIPRLERLTDCATHELRQFDYYNSKLERAKTAMKIARNCSTTVVSINNVPAEILRQVFDLVLCTQPCIGDRINDTFGTKSHAIVYPDHLSHVCYHWRQVAIHSRTLWRHIDLVSSNQLSSNLLARATEFATRAGRSLLDIHAIRPHSATQSDCADITQFLGSVAKHMRSLHLIADDGDAGFCHSVLQQCFSGCIAGALTQLSIRGPLIGASRFIEAAENPQTPESLLLDVPQQSIEDVYLPMSILRVHGIYPRWESRAYHGLVELHLTRPSSFDPPGPASTITGSQIAGILTSSPRLRVFRFDLEITDPLPSNASILPLHLDNLEVLDFPFMHYDQFEVLLRWIAPMSNPLQLSFALPIEQSWLTPPSTASEAKKLFTRLNVTKACLDGTAGASLQQVTELLYLTPRLRALVLHNFSPGDDFSPAPHPNETDTQNACPRLDLLYMTYCGFDSDALQALQEMIERHSVQKLILWKCYSSSLPYDFQLIDDVSSVFPTAEFIPRDHPNPVGDWGLSL